MKSKSGIEEYVGDYTSNVNAMYEKDLGMEFREPDGMKTKEAAVIPEIGVMHMMNNGREYMKLNPKNGYGDYNTAVVFLVMIMEA